MTYAVGSIVEAVDYNNLIDKYNGYFASTGGLGLTKVSVSSLVTRDQWYQLWQKVFDAASAAGRSVTLPFHSSAPGENPFSDTIAPRYGYLISALPSWGPVGDAPANVKVSWSPTRVTGTEPAPGPPPPPATGDATFSQNYTPGTYNYTVPANYVTMTVEVAAGGGAGGGVSFVGAAPSGDAGGPSRFLSQYAYGGDGGQGTLYDIGQDTRTNTPADFPAGASGSAGGGDQNIQDGGGAGGAGNGYTVYDGYNGSGYNQVGGGTAGSGKNGGKSIKTYTAGQPGAPAGGTVIAVLVGKGGSNNAGPDAYKSGFAGGVEGGDGYVKITGTLATSAPVPPPPAGTSFITFRAVLDKPSNSPVTVNYATSDLGATSTGSTTPFSQNYDAPGTNRYTLPNYTTLTVEVAGAGGGDGFGGNTVAGAQVGQPLPPQAGKPGGDSSFGSVVGQGGPGGPTALSQYPGAQGNGVGGDTNTPGGGAKGGTTYPGSTSGNGDVSIFVPDYIGGGNGGKAVKTWTAGSAGAPTPGSIVTVVVGAGGDAALYENYDCNRYLTESNWQAGYDMCIDVRGRPGWVHISGLIGEGNTTGVGNATAGQDYVPASGTLTFAPGETYKDVPVQILADNLVEPDESFLITLSNAQGATIGTAQATGVILGNGTVAGSPPPPPPPAVQHGYWEAYYEPLPELSTASRFFGQQNFHWHATADEPTPPPGTPFPFGFTSQGQTCQSDGTCGSGSFCPCSGLMSYGNPYTGDPVLTCFPGRKC